jgi:pilus assembly protein CpaB
MTLPSAARRHLRRMRRRVLLHRRPLAALAAAGAVLLGLEATTAPPPPTVPVWTAARDLPGGTVLSADDLVSSGFAPGTVPDDVVGDLRLVLGRRLAAPLSRGEPLTTVRTVAPGLLRGYPGRTAVPVRITDGDVVDLLRVGDRVTLVLADPDGRTPPRTLVEDVPLVGIPPIRATGLSTGTPGRLVVAAVPSALAADVAAGAATGILIPVWTR